MRAGYKYSPSNGLTLALVSMNVYSGAKALAAGQSVVGRRARVSCVDLKALVPRDEDEMEVKM